MASNNTKKSPSEEPGRLNRETRVCKRLEIVKEYLDQKQWKPHNESSAPDVKIRRWKYGTEDIDKRNKTILLLGETGTGKTSLLNTLVNHMMGVKFEDKVWYDIAGEGEKDSSESQTACVTVYEINVNKWPIALTIIDTPGYGDTRGVKHDEAIADNLGELFDSYGGIDTINAVGLVVKSSQNRLTDFQHYVFNSVLSLFGKDIENNIVIFITHSDGLDPTDALNAVKKANTRCAKDEEGEPVHFLFNNRQSEPYKKNQTKSYSHYWKMGGESIEDFFKHIERTKAQSLRMTSDVLMKRKDLQTNLEKLMETIAKAKEEEKQLKNITEVVRKNKAKLDNNERFRYLEDVTTTKKVAVEEQFPGCTEKAMCCDVCKKNCHFPGCTYVDNLRWCAVMKRGKCTKCGCSHEAHSKEHRLYMPVPETVTKTNEDLKKECEARYGDTKNLQQKIETNLTEKRQEMSYLAQNAYDFIIRLEEIALHGKAVTINVNFDILIEKLSETNQNDKVEKLKEIMDKFPAPQKLKKT